jgi:hypothetical protein
MNNNREAVPASLAKEEDLIPLTNHSSGNAIQPDVAVPFADNFNDRYWAYQNWCDQIGLPSASFGEWERINRQVAEDSFTFPPGKNRTVRSRGTTRENADCQEPCSQ